MFTIPVYHLSSNVSFLVLPKRIVSCIACFSCTNGSICAHVTTRLRYVSVFGLYRFGSFFLLSTAVFWGKENMWIYMCGHVYKWYGCLHILRRLICTLFSLLCFLFLSSSISFHCRVDHARSFSVSEYGD
jgi:hypothetical protein